MRELKNIRFQPKHALISIFLVFILTPNMSLAFNDVNYKEYSGLNAFETPFVEKEKATLLLNTSKDSLQYYKDSALRYAHLGNAEASVNYIKKYIYVSQDFSILNDHLFKILQMIFPI